MSCRSSKSYSPSAVLLQHGRSGKLCHSHFKANQFIMKIKVVILTLLVTSIVSSGALAQGFLKKLANKASNAGSDLIVKKTGEQAEKAMCASLILAPIKNRIY